MQIRHAQEYIRLSLQSVSALMYHPQGFLTPSFKTCYSVLDYIPSICDNTKLRNTLHEISKREANWIGHVSRRNCLLQRLIEGKKKGGIEVTGRRGRRRRKLLDDPKERRGYSHWMEDAVGGTMWRAHFGKGFGPVVRQSTN